MTKIEKKSRQMLIFDIFFDLFLAIGLPIAGFLSPIAGISNFHSSDRILNTAFFEYNFDFLQFLTILNHFRT